MQSAALCMCNRTVRCRNPVREWFYGHTDGVETRESEASLDTVIICARKWSPIPTTVSDVIAGLTMLQLKISETAMQQELSVIIRITSNPRMQSICLYAAERCDPRSAQEGHEGETQPVCPRGTAKSVDQYTYLKPPKEVRSRYAVCERSSTMLCAKVGRSSTNQPCISGERTYVFSSLSLPHLF